MFSTIIVLYIYYNTFFPPFNLEQHLLKNGYPAYTTSVGWKGYSDEKIRTLCKQALNDGWKRQVVRYDTA